MLLPVERLVFLPAVLGVDAASLAARASGVAADLAELMNRLGDVRACSLGGEGSTAWEQGELSLDEPGVFAALMAGRNAGLAVVIRLQDSAERLVLNVELVEDGRPPRWSGRSLFADGTVVEARLALAANLIEAATGRRKDLRRGRRGGTTVLEAYQRACEARAAGTDSQRRVRLLEDAIALDPDYLDAQLLLADAFEASGSPVRGQRVLAVIARRFPRYAIGRLRYGLALRSMGRYDQAFDEVQAALEADPDGVTLFHAGLFAEADGDDETAALLYERAQERGCVDAALCDRLARFRARSGRPGEAAVLWDRARSIDPERSDLVGDLALAHHRSGDSEEAERLFDLALETASGRFRTHASRALYLQDCGRHVAALASSTRALVLDGESAAMYNVRGEARLALQDRWGARRDFVRALEHVAEDALAVSIRTNIARLARGPRTEEAEQAFLAALRLYREAPAQSLEALEGVLDLEPAHWQAWLLVGLVSRDQGDWHRASDAFGAVVRIRGQHPQAQSERALALLALDRPEEALRFARLAASEAPNDSAIICNLGLVQMETGALDEAKETFLGAQETAPEDPVIERCLAELKSRRRKDPRWGESWTAGP